MKDLFSLLNPDVVDGGGSRSCLVDQSVEHIQDSQSRQIHQIAPSQRETSVESISGVEGKIRGRNVINSNFLNNRPMIKLAIRKKTAGGKFVANLRTASLSTPNGSNSTKAIQSQSPSPKSMKLNYTHLDPVTRVRLTLSPSLSELYFALVPFVHVQQLNILCRGPTTDLETKRSYIMKDHNTRKISSASLVSKDVKLIDDNLMNLSNVSSKALQTLNRSSAVPTFNSMDMAINALFGLQRYTAVRVTRAAATEPDGSTLLKLETAAPGDHWLVDSDLDNEDMLDGIGESGEALDGAFIKKVIARPRFKSDMKIYILPEKLTACLYTNKRMLERDLINGIVDLNDCDRIILCSFDYQSVVMDYGRLLAENGTGMQHMLPRENLLNSSEFHNRGDATANIDVSDNKRRRKSKSFSMDFSRNMLMSPSFQHHPPPSTNISPPAHRYSDPNIGTYYSSDQNNCYEMDMPHQGPFLTPHSIYQCTSNDPYMLHNPYQSPSANNMQSFRTVQPYLWSPFVLQNRNRSRSGTFLGNSENTITRDGSYNSNNPNFNIPTSAKR